MFVVYGIRSVWRRPVAFRNDYCLSCSSPRVSLLVRQFWYFHLFWIPLLPFGLYRTWYCGTCGQRPHARTRTSSGVLRLAIVATLVIVALFLWDSDTGDADPLMTVWRISALLAIPPAVVFWLKAPPDNELSTQLQAVRPSEVLECPVCRGAVQPHRPFVCTGCGIERQSL